MFCVSILPSSHLFSKPMTLHTRGARGDSDLNLTLDERPATASRTRRQPRKKNTPCISDLAGGGEFFLEKGKGVFLSGFCPPSIRAVWRGEMRTRQSKNYFCGRKRILLCFGSFCFGVGLPPRRRVREECATDSFLIFARGLWKKSRKKRKMKLWLR